MAANADTAAILAAIGDVRRSTKAFVAGVSSRKFSEASLRAAQTQARDEQLDRMAKVLKSTATFRFEDLTVLRDLAFKMDRRTYQPGEAVIRQGDRGTEFFVIDSGEGAIYIQGRHGRRNSSPPPLHRRETRLARLVRTHAPDRVIGGGEFFGEISLLTSAPRSAWVVAHGRRPLRVLVMDQKVFAGISDRGFKSSWSETLHDRLMDRIPVLHAIPRAKRAAVRALMRPCDFADGEVLFKQGDEGLALFVILEGCVRISQRRRVESPPPKAKSPTPDKHKTKRKKDGVAAAQAARAAAASPHARFEEVVRAHLHYLDFFGEVALLKSCTRTATATAEGPVTCMTLHKHHFNAISSVATEALEMSAQRRNDGDQVAGTAGETDVEQLTAQERTEAFDRHQAAVAEEKERHKDELLAQAMARAGVVRPTARAGPMGKRCSAAILLDVRGQEAAAARAAEHGPPEARRLSTGTAAQIGAHATEAGPTGFKRIQRKLSNVGRHMDRVVNAISADVLLATVYGTLVRRCMRGRMDGRRLASLPLRLKLLDRVTLTTDPLAIVDECCNLIQTDLSARPCARDVRVVANATPGGGAAPAVWTPSECAFVRELLGLTEAAWVLEELAKVSACHAAKRKKGGGDGSGSDEDSSEASETESESSESEEDEDEARDAAVLERLVGRLRPSTLVAKKGVPLYAQGSSDTSRCYVILAGHVDLLYAPEHSSKGGGGGGGSGSALGAEPYELRSYGAGAFFGATRRGARCVSAVPSRPTDLIALDARAVARLAEDAGRPLGHVDKFACCAALSCLRHWGPKRLDKFAAGLVDAGWRPAGTTLVRRGDTTAHLQLVAEGRVGFLAAEGEDASTAAALDALADPRAAVLARAQAERRRARDREDARAEARGEKRPDRPPTPPPSGGGGEAFGANKVVASAARVRARALGAKHDSSAHAARHSRASAARSKRRALKVLATGGPGALLGESSLVSNWARAKAHALAHHAKRRRQQKLKRLEQNLEERTKGGASAVLVAQLKRERDNAEVKDREENRAAEKLKERQRRALFVLDSKVLAGEGPQGTSPSKDKDAKKAAKAATPLIKKDVFAGPLTAKQRYERHVTRMLGNLQPGTYLESMSVVATSAVRLLSLPAKEYSYLQDNATFRRLVAQLAERLGHLGARQDAATRTHRRVAAAREAAEAEEKAEAEAEAAEKAAEAAEREAEAEADAIAEGKEGEDEEGETKTPAARVPRTGAKVRRVGVRATGPPPRSAPRSGGGDGTWVEVGERTPSVRHPKAHRTAGSLGHGRPQTAELFVRAERRAAELEEIHHEMIMHAMVPCHGPPTRESIARARAREGRRESRARDRAAARGRGGEGGRGRRHAAGVLGGRRQAAQPGAAAGGPARRGHRPQARRRGGRVPRALPRGRRRRRARRRAGAVLRRRRARRAGPRAAAAGVRRRRRAHPVAGGQPRGVHAHHGGQDGRGAGRRAADRPAAARRVPARQRGRAVPPRGREEPAARRGPAAARPRARRVRRRGPAQGRARAARGHDRGEHHPARGAAAAGGPRAADEPAGGAAEGPRGRDAAGLEPGREGRERGRADRGARRVPAVARGVAAADEGRARGRARGHHVHVEDGQAGRRAAAAAAAEPRRADARDARREPGRLGPRAARARGVGRRARDRVRRGDGPRARRGARAGGRRARRGLARGPAVARALALPVGRVAGGELARGVPAAEPAGEPGAERVRRVAAPGGRLGQLQRHGPLRLQRPGHRVARVAAPRAQRGRAPGRRVQPQGRPRRRAGRHARLHGAVRRPPDDEGGRPGARGRRALAARQALGAGRVCEPRVAGGRRRRGDPAAPGHERVADGRPLAAARVDRQRAPGDLRQPAGLAGLRAVVRLGAAVVAGRREPGRAPRRGRGPGGGHGAHAEGPAAAGVARPRGVDAGRAPPRARHGAQRPPPAARHARCMKEAEDTPFFACLHGVFWTSQ